MPRRHALLIAQWIAWAALLLLPTQSRAQGVWREGFESPETSWRSSASDTNYRIEAHARVQRGAHTGTSCEQLRVAGNNGSYINFGHPIGSARVIGELSARVWLRADRPGLQLLAHVVLPRTIDPTTNRPATLLVSGSSYTQVGVWQSLQIGDLPQLVERQVRVLRTTMGSSVDAREAFVDAIVLNVYGGPGVTNVWIDDLEVSGRIPVAAAATENVNQNIRQVAATEESLERLPAVWEASSSVTTAGAVPDVKLQGNVLFVGGRPFFPRAIQHRGEPLEYLQKLGFNTVKTPTLPDLELLEEADRIGMWLIAQPPLAADLTTRNSTGKLAKIGRDFDRVLAWDLGEGLTAQELDVVRPWIKALRAADPRGRPIVCQPDADLRSYSRYADILSIERRPLGSSQELNEYGMWLRSRTQLARPGTPVWTTITTQPTRQLAEQLALLSPGQPPMLNWQHEQLRLLVLTALSAGMRGICFESLTPLDAKDAETQHRAALIEWLNLELELIQPWTSGGSFVTTAECTDSQLVGVVMQTERARLLLPLAIAAHNQFAVDHGSTGALSFVVPGAPESNRAFELSPAGLRPLTHRRVTGGMRVTLSEGDRTSPIVMTQDPAVISTLSRRATQAGRRMFELQRLTSAQNLTLVADIDRRLQLIGRNLPGNAKLLETARSRLNQSEQIAATNDLPLSEERARQAVLALRQLERSQWTQASSAFSSPLASPFAVSFQTLPEHWQFVNFLASAQRGRNRLSDGECESLDTMLTNGWKHLQHTQPGIATTVELAADNPHSGRFSLHLKATAEDPQQKSEIVESPPLWITTAPVLVEPGELLQINGFVRVPGRVEGSIDGLMIIDSISGDALAERVRTTRDWREFTLYRVAPRSENLTITFALTGFGEAWIDDVSIQAVDRGALNAQASRLPPADENWRQAQRR